MSLLEVRGLDIIYRYSSGAVNVVSGVKFDIHATSVFGLAGESGCGKTLTALAIMGLLPPGMHVEGSINFRGADLLRLKPDELRALRGNDISMIFQEPMTALNPVLRVGYQIEEVINTHFSVARREARRITLGLLRAVRIPDPEIRVREYPHQLSGGMRQRVMVAMAIACSPSLLIADEPTTALDVTIEAQLLELLRGLRDERKMGVLLITHDLGVIAENADTVAIMYAGRIVEMAPVEMLFNRPSHPYTMGLLRSLPGGRGKALRPIPGTVPRPGHLPEGCKFSERCEYAISGCEREEPALRPTNGGEDAAPHLSRCIRAGELKWN